jgi:hypothetical protein
MKLFNFLTATIVFATSSVAMGATAFFSTDGFGDGASIGNPHIQFNSLSSAAPADLHIYFVPESSDAKFLGISLGVRSTTPNVANMTAFSVSNFDFVIAPDTPLGETRWNAAGVAGATVDLVSNLYGLSIDQAGLSVINDGVGSTFLDKGYDTSANAFYFGSVTLDPVGVGSTDYFLTVGDIGIARLGDNPQPTGPTASLTFGAAEPTSVFGDDFGATGTVYDAHITIIPEPSSILLLCSALVLSLRRRR